MLAKGDFYFLKWGVHNVILANLKNLSDKLNKEIFSTHLRLNLKEIIDKTLIVQMRKIVRKIY